MNSSCSNRNSTRERLRRVVAGVLITSLTACTTMGPISPREYVPIEHPSQIWVTKSDNSTVVMQLPKLLGDTLVGYVNGDYQEMMLSQTKVVQARRPAPGRTALAVGTAVTALVVTGALVSGSGAPCTKWSVNTWVPC